MMYRGSPIRVSGIDNAVITRKKEFGNFKTTLVAGTVQSSSSVTVLSIDVVLTPVDQVLNNREMASIALPDEGEFLGLHQKQF